ncbi:DUF5615 family PIN-like protein [Mesorhizobium carmichaelinearum]|uniref:DUF5615 family PIN-like protein n=1 Tax=Mesorhizobium carmichaelinearum TaxID=1208188 RepID=UPI0034E05C35
MKTLLDENISPALRNPLWERGIDTVTVRDRGLLSADDMSFGGWDRLKIDQ